MSNPRRYSDIRKHLDTGDIVLFSGKGPLSAGIKHFTGSRWSHVGMVLKLARWDMVLLWESTTLSTVRDIENGRARAGVQLVPLSERMRRFSGDVAVRTLNVRRTPDMLESLAIFRRLVSKRPYEASTMELLKAAYDGPGGQNTEDLSSLFCSELVAEAYQKMGLLGEDKPSNEYTPADFSGGLALLRKASLGPEVEVELW